MPVVTGPILLLLALEQGQAFAANAAVAAVSSVTAFVAFAVGYARSAPHLPWGWSYLISLGVWAIVACGLAALNATLPLSMMISGIALWLAGRLIPCSETGHGHRSGFAEMSLRLLAGLLLTLLVTAVAATYGAFLSGLLTVFPVLAGVLAVFSHRAHGAAFVVPLMRGLTRGLISLYGFCVCLALALPQIGLFGGFASAILVVLVVQLLTGGYLRRWVFPSAP